MSRPSSYTPELAEDICALLAAGRSLNSVCKADGMPCMSTVMNWLVKAERGDPLFSGFLEKYLRAREAQADVIFDECLDIADASAADWRADKNTGELVVNGDAIQRAKLRIDTRMRMAGKLKPKKYGDRTILAGDQENPVQLDVSDARSKLLGGIVPQPPAPGADQTS